MEKRLYLTYLENDRHIQRADINEDNYVCNVESSDEDAEKLVNAYNEYDDLRNACYEALSFVEDMPDFKHQEGLIDTLKEALNLEVEER